MFLGGSLRFNDVPLDGQTGGGNLNVESGVLGVGVTTGASSCWGRRKQTWLTVRSEGLAKPALLHPLGEDVPKSHRLLQVLVAHQVAK